MNDASGPLSPAPAASPTPMMEQYIEIKTANPDCLLFYRMGDFYELFFDDAEVASRALGIALTKRGKHLGADIPMCGVPVHAADEYLQRLIALGHRVAVCEQTEDPAAARKRGSKSVVRREVTRLVTPGTITEELLLEPGRNNYLAAVARGRGTGAAGGDLFALAWIDISTGEFRVASFDGGRLSAELARVDARELLVADALHADEALGRFWRELGQAVTPLAASFFDSATAASRLADYFKVQTPDSFGDFSRVELSAAAAALAYVEKTQMRERPPLVFPAREAGADIMLIDGATRANLELMRTLSGDKRGSLFAAIDRTVTGGGSRLVAQRLAGPSTDPDVIGARLDAVSFLLSESDLRARVRDSLKAAPDMTRALSRLTLNRGGPRDLSAIAAGLDAARGIGAMLDATAGAPLEIASARDALAQAPHALAARLGLALADELPVLKRDGGFVRDGFHDGLDETRSLRDESRRVVASLQSGYADDTGVKALKIRHNNVLGYFIEVSAIHAERMLAPPLSQRFIHRQTMAGAVRFTTTELADLESRIATAADRVLALELGVFEELRDAVVAKSDGIRAAAEALATLDVAAGLAALAESESYARPTVDDSLAFAIDGGRHPVVEQALRASQQAAFIANDSDLGPAAEQSAGRIWLVTGPNMAGKSTFLRQNALIAILAQIGSFVPAPARAHRRG